MRQFENDNELDRGDFYKLIASVFMKVPSDEVISKFDGIAEITQDESEHKICHDFHDLFAHNQVSLYESFYNHPVEEGPRPWGRATGEVRRFYESMKLIIEEDRQIIPDHIATELLFMSYLTDNEFVNEQIRFLREHLSKWVPIFCNEVDAHEKTEFYRKIAILLKELVSSDYKELGGI